MLKDILVGEDSCSFAFFSANVQHVLGMTSRYEQVDLFERAVTFSKIQASTDYSFHFSDLLINEQWQRLIPGIITTFHYGHYRLLPFLLLLSDISICILVSQAVKEEQEEYYRTILGDEQSARISFAVAEDPKLFFQIKSLLDKGYHILCYADGGKGLGKIQVQNHAMQMDFLHTKLWVRTGFAHMAYLAGVPIYAYWDGMKGKNSSDFQPIIYHPATNHSRKDFVRDCLHTLYTDFAQSVSMQPFSWENLFYLQESISLSEDADDSMRTDRYIPFRQDDHYFILDKLQYLSYAINLSQFNSFCNILAQKLTV